MVGKRKKSEGEGEPKSRNITTIDISDDAFAAIEGFVNRRGGHGMKKHMLSKVLAWFAIQPDAVKSVIVGWVDEGMESAYANTLRKLADDLESPPPDPHEMPSGHGARTIPTASGAAQRESNQKPQSPGIRFETGPKVDRVTGEPVKRQRNG